MTPPRSFPVLRLLTTVAFTALAAGCQTADTPPSRAANVNSPAVKYMDVDGARLAYAEQGSGEPVVLIHGALGDYRLWDAHRPAIASNGFRAVSYTQRYFGTDSWSERWPPFSSQLHASDLASFLRTLKTGPAHLVTWSYSGHIALSVALDNPELVKSIFAYEPAAPTYVSNPVALKTVEENSGVMFGPAVQSLKQGDDSEAVRRVIGGVAGKGEDYFHQQPKRIQDIQMDSARTMSPLVNSPPPRQITCTQLASIKAPVAIVQGSSTTPTYRVIAETAASCMPAAKHIVVPGVGHMWPTENPAGFSSTLVAFLKTQSASR